MNVNRIAGIIVLLFTTGGLGGQVFTAKNTAKQESPLQQALTSTFALTQISNDRSSVIQPGASLLLQKDGLLLYATACPSSPINSYDAKKGKISQPIGRGFLRDLGGSMQMSGNATTAQCPQRRFGPGTPLFVTGIDVRKNETVFHLFSTPENDVPYYGDLSFPFDKGPPPTNDQELSLVAQVLGQQAQSAPANPLPPIHAASALVLPATFVNSQSKDDTLVLKADHTYSLQQAGQSYQGSFQIDGNSVALVISADTTSKATIEGDRITDANGQTWMLQKQ